MIMHRFMKIMSLSYRLGTVNDFHWGRRLHCSWVWIVFCVFLLTCNRGPTKCDNVCLINHEHKIRILLKARTFLHFCLMPQTKYQCPAHNIFCIILKKSLHFCPTPSLFINVCFPLKIMF